MAKKTVFVVDDSPDVTFSVKQGLENLDDNIEVIPADSGEKCFQLLESNKKPDLILLDIMMPDMSGWETYDKIKENKSFNDIPIVFLTARTDRVAENAGRFLGHDYIEKPFDMEGLKDRIDKIIEKNE